MVFQSVTTALCSRSNLCVGHVGRMTDLQGVRFTIWQRHDGAYQLDLGDEAGGYRLVGPKFMGSSMRLAYSVPLSQTTINEVRRYLDKAEARIVDVAIGDADKCLPSQNNAFVMRFDVDWDASLRERISQALADEFNDEAARWATDTILFVVEPSIRNTE